MKVKTIVEELSVAPDPVEWFRQLSKDGTVPGTLLLESADIVTRHGEKSLIIPKAALKAVCRGGEVVISALTPGGKVALRVVADQLRDHVREQSDAMVVCHFDKPDANDNLAARLIASSPFDVIRAMTNGFTHEEDAPAGSFLSAGIFSYDLIDWVEDLPAAKKDELNFPDYVFWLTETLIVIDHQKQITHVIRHEFGETTPTLTNLTPQPPLQQLERGSKAQIPLSTWWRGVRGEVGDDEFSQIVRDLKKRIVAGDVFQIVPSRSFQVPCAAPLDAYRHLRSFNPSPYMYYIVDDDWTVFGASPETYIKVGSKSRRVEVRPIAGTRRRGMTRTGEIDHELDVRREAELRLDEKELAEHMMLVDLARNDVARVSEPKTRGVEQLLTVERYSHVMHLVSCVNGHLRADLDGLHAYQASMNMGTLVGAPKVKAAEILRQTEKTKRAFYGGAVGYFDRDGNMDTAILIRSALVRDGVAHVRAGAGVVYDSVPEEETQETKNKAEAVLRAIAHSSVVTPAKAGVHWMPASAGMTNNMRVLLIDNFDSFTFNLAEEFESRQCDVQVWRNNLSVSRMLELVDALTGPKLVVISPGPGTPREAGCCIELIQQLRGRAPLLGVCLGHQAIVEAFGGTVGPAESIMHGKTSVIHHDGIALFDGLPQRLQVARYHSLCATALPASLKVRANCGDLVMAIEHESLPIWGVQFHPESILTTEGGLMIDNALAWAQRCRT